MKKTFDALTDLAKEVSTDKRVSDESLRKTGAGIEFTTKNFVNLKPYSEGVTILTHAPPDGDTVRLARDSTDNALTIVNDATGEISAWFYRDGRSYVNLLDQTIENHHLADLSVGPAKLKLLAVENPNLADLSVGPAKVRDNTIERRMVVNGEIIRGALNDDTRNQGTGTSSMRTIGFGSSTSAAGSNHVHASVNFNADYSLEEKVISAGLVQNVRGMTVQPQLESLRLLVLDLARQLMDERDHDVVEKVRRLRDDPAYAHEFRMKHDAGYFAAFMLDNNPRYAEACADDDRVKGMADVARKHYGKIDSDPAKVEDAKRKYPGEFLPKGVIDAEHT